MILMLQSQGHHVLMQLKITIFLQQEVSLKRYNYIIAHNSFCYVSLFQMTSHEAGKLLNDFTMIRI